MARKRQEDDLLGTDDGATLYEEDALAKAIGIYRGRLHKARARVAAALWRYDHGRVAYTKEGALAIMREVGVALPKKKGGVDPYGRKALEEALEEAELGVPAEGLEGCERLVVMRISGNVKIVMAGMMTDPELPYGFQCRVIVGRNENFVRGMELLARPVEKAQYLYRLVGPLPRARGRW